MKILKKSLYLLNGGSWPETWRLFLKLQDLEIQNTAVKLKFENFFFRPVVVVVVVSYFLNFNIM